MKKISSLLVFILAALCLAAPSLHADEEEKIETEVAVRIGKITRATLRRAIAAFGVVEPQLGEAGSPPASARLSPATPGIIAEANGVEGQHVEKGTVLFRLDSRAADAAVAKAEAAVQFAQKNADRQKKLIAAEGTSEKLVLEAEQALAGAKTELAAASVQQSLLRGEAPLAGTLVRFSARPGEAADITLPLAEIVDLDRLTATVRVPRADAAALRVEQKAQLLVGGSAAPIESAVTFISSQVDALTDTVLVRLSVTKGAGLRPGQFVSARIFSEERPDRLVVPVASVVKDADGASFIALVENGKAVRKPIKTGLREAGLVEIEGADLTEGQTVVTVGAYGLPEQTKVRILNAEPK